jgi:hypothetical protein
VVGVALVSSEAIYILASTQKGATVVKLSPDGSKVRYSSNAIVGAEATAFAVDAGGALTSRVQQIPVS